MSGGGVFESLDAGASWRPFNRGVALDFFPEELKDQPYGHDPHCVVLHPTRPDRLYQQNHCGIYVSAELAEDLGVAVGEDDEVELICALSGGAGPRGLACLPPGDDTGRLWALVRSSVWPGDSTGRRAWKRSWTRWSTP